APSRRRVKACDMSNDSTHKHLIGTWKLITAVREEIASGTKTEFLGPNPVGYINYGADGRMLVLTGGSSGRCVHWRHMPVPYSARSRWTPSPRHTSCAL